MWCLNVWANCYKGNSPTELIDKMDEEGVVFDSEKQFSEFIGLSMDAHNHTKIMENRGHAPCELSMPLKLGRSYAVNRACKL